MIAIVIHALYFFIPAYVANTCACLFGKGKPVDHGRAFTDGRRILGDGVTIRGSLVGILSGVAAGVLMVYFENLVASPQFTEKILLAFLLSTGAIAGDAAGSFIKRRLNISRGAPAPLLDQLNFVIGGLLFASLIQPIKLETVLVLLILTPIGHLMVNFTGYHLKLKDVPW
jgi:CDP-2,3-bis-(O-geranylgeranyl)-sn-glycerol synthase